MNHLTLCGLAFICVLFALFFKQLNSNFSILISILFGLLIIQYTLQTAADKISVIQNLFKETSINEYFGVLLKAFGITFISETTSDICKDLGESAIASKVELIGKIELLAISLPLIEEIIQTTKSIML